MDWRIKGCIQGVLSRLPGGERLNDLLQTAVGGRADEAHHIDVKFRADWLVLMDMLEVERFDVTDKVLMEVGTGWLPVLPICFALAGARTVHSFDLHRHLVPNAAATVLKHLKPLLGELAKACRQPPDTVVSRHASLIAALEAGGDLQRIGIEYHAPADASATGLPAGAVDLVFSNSVLEHVTECQLAALMRESARVLGDDGLVLHSVNCGDHYAYFDKSITQIHYLRFTSREWRRWNNDLLFQNRLRPRDFLAAAESAGLRVGRKIQTVRQELLAKLPQTPIAPEFRQYGDEELCTTSVTFVAQPVRGA